MKKIISFALSFLLLFIVVGCKAEPKREAITNQYENYYKGVNMEKVVSYLVKDNASQFKIVTPTKATEAEEYAAIELQSFVQQSTGARIAIISDENMVFNENDYHFSIGRTTILEGAKLGTDYSTLNYDGFVIKTIGKTVVIDAVKDRGFLYGVYDFLEKFLNIRFFNYDETYVPTLTVVPIYELNIVEVPAFGMRTYLDGDVYVNWADDEFVARSRTNSTFVSPSAKFGGTSNMYGRNNTHNFHYYVPESQYGKTHPEFYYKDAQYGTTIDLTNGITDDGKLDESMEVSVLKVAIEEMKKDIIKFPNVDFFVFEQEDGPFYYESAKNSQEAVKYKRSGMLIRFCNIMATELQKWADKELNGRKINLVTFAYDYTSEAPVKNDNGKIVPIHPTCVAADNLLVRMAQGSNSYYGYFDERQGDTLKARFKEWKIIADKFMFWGYDTDYSDYLSYYPSLQGARNTTMGLKEYGMQYVLIQSTHNTLTNWQANMKQYVYNKLLWTPNQDVSRLLTEYLNGYYGLEAAKYVTDFKDLFDRYYAVLIAEDPSLTLGTFSKLKNKVAVEVLDDGIKILKDGIEKIENSSYTNAVKVKTIKRLQQVLVTPMWMKLNNFSTYFPMAEPSERRELAQEFFDICDGGGVATYSESMSIASLKRNYNIT